MNNLFECSCAVHPISQSLWGYIADVDELWCPSSFRVNGNFTLFSYLTYCPGTIK